MSSTHMKGRNSLTEREILWDYKCNFASVNTWFIGDLRNSMIVHVDVLTSTMAPAEPLEANLTSRALHSRRMHLTTLFRLNLPSRAPQSSPHAK